MIGQNGTWTDISNGGKTVAITANTTVYARLFDGTNAGTTASCGITNIDKTAPVGTSVRHNSGNGGCSWQNNINITLSASDNVGIAHYEIDWNADGNADGTTAANFVPWNNFSSDNVRFRAVDHAGNRGAWSGSIHVHMDTQAPWITNWWWGTATTSNVSLYIQVADNAAGVRNATVKVSTSTGGYGNWRDYGWVWDAGANAYRTDINPATFGHWGCNYRAQLYMWDNAGNGGYIAQSGDVSVTKMYVCRHCYGTGRMGKYSSGFGDYYDYRYNQ